MTKRKSRKSRKSRKKELTFNANELGHMSGAISQALQRTSILIDRLENNEDGRPYEERRNDIRRLKRHQDKYVEIGDKICAERFKG